jgi:adenine/guanine/hypoxanthine permease
MTPTTPPLSQTRRGPAHWPANTAPAPKAAHDIRGGLVSFLGSVYIVVLIPMILAQQGPVASIPATALACAAGTLLFALVTKLPFAVGPGIVPASIVATFLANGIAFRTVLGIELIAGLLFMLLVASGAVRTCMRRTPPVLKHAGQIAIGLYLLMAALRATGLLHADGGIGKAALGHEGMLFLAGLAVVFVLHRAKRIGGYAILIGIAVATAGAAALGLIGLPASVFEAPDIVLPTPDLLGALDLRYLDETLILLYVVIVDVAATLETIATCSPDLRGADGRLRHFDQGLFMSAVVFLASPLLGSVPMLVFFESLGGVMSGARTQRAALVCALGFLAMVFVAPLAGAVPAFACAVALGFIGCTITQHAASALPGGAGEAQAAALGRQLASVAVIAMIVTNSVALTLFALFAVYPVALLSAGQRPRGGAVVAALASVALVATMFA